MYQTVDSVLRGRSNPGDVETLTRIGWWNSSTNSMISVFLHCILLLEIGNSDRDEINEQLLVDKKKAT